MARLTIGQKAIRVTQFLVGLRNRRVASTLSACGFGEADLAEGWSLLTALTDGRLGASSTLLDGSLLAELDDWENEWFPIASASLRNRFPDDYAKLFKNLTQTEGVEVITSVGTFLTRLSSLSAPARERLARRGINDATVAAAQALLQKLGTPEPPQVGDLDAAEDQRRVDAMWNWYLEWSEIARTKVKSPKLLRAMGFLKPDGSNEPDPETDVPDPAAPGEPKRD